MCAIDPSRRDEYARQVHRLLRDKGRLAGVLFDCEFQSSPPFGGSMAEYRALFEPYFGIQTMERFIIQSSLEKGESCLSIL
ncbi:hypothetical protein ACSF86_10530 [Moraxella bovoculi]|uniref:hypothetical protein n=1 Tax=Moraxella bovoculi TaxID=386891 RepID=UPI003F50C771